MIEGIARDLQAIPKELKEKIKEVNKKQLILKSAPYVILGYVLNKESWLYGQQAGENTLLKVLDTINGIGDAFQNPFPSIAPVDLLVGIGCGIGFRLIVYYKAKHAKKFRQGVEYGSARWGADLTVSGHIHGGLMRLPVLGGVISPRLCLFPHYDGGRFTKAGREMILSRGLGTHTLPIRIFNPGELVVIHLKPKNR